MELLNYQFDQAIRNIKHCNKQYLEALTFRSNIKSLCEISNISNHINVIKTDSIIMYTKKSKILIKYYNDITIEYLNKYKDNLFIINTNDENVNPKYLFYYLKFNRHTIINDLKKFDTENVKLINIHLPILEKQNTIVNSINTHINTINCMRNYSRNMDDIYKLGLES